MRPAGVPRSLPYPHHGPYWRAPYTGPVLVAIHHGRGYSGRLCHGRATVDLALPPASKAPWAWTHRTDPHRRD